MTAGVSYANRGSFLEEAIQWVNQVYRGQGLALIHKVPTPFIPVRGARGANGRRPVVGAKVEEKAALDFLGVYAGVPVAFDTKETHRPSWPLQNLETHQAEFLRDWSRMGGIAFLLIYFASAKPAGKLYLVPWEEVSRRLDAKRAGKGPASIPMKDLADRPAITQGRHAAFDYLAAVDAAFPEITANKSTGR